MQGFKRRVSKAGRANSRKRPREDDDTPGVSPPGAARQAPVLPSGSRLAGAVAQAREAKSLSAAFGSRSSALASGQDAPRVAPALPAQAGAADGTPSGRERPGKTFAAPMVDPVANAEAVKDDAIARFEARLSLHDEAKKRTAAPLGQRLYRGTDGYTDFRKRGSAKDAKSAAMAAGTIGPLRAATTVRSTFVTDFQKGLCKDYFETGYCGFGDTCIYMHDRSSRRAGWQVDRDWEASQKRKQERKMRRAAGEEGVSDDSDDDNAHPHADGIRPGSGPATDDTGWRAVRDALVKKSSGKGPSVALARARVATAFGPETSRPAVQGPAAKDQGTNQACCICKGPAVQPVAPQCGHVACEACALQRQRMDPEAACAHCSLPTGGIFNAVETPASREGSRVADQAADEL